jgi:hypothetical protein
MDTCMVCGSPNPECHHVFFGISNRKWSEKYRLVVPLCHIHHRGSDLSPHFNKDFDLKLKQYAQERFQEEYPDLDFKSIFGKNFI